MYVMLARVIRLEADVKHSLDTPKTVDSWPHNPISVATEK